MAGKIRGLPPENGLVRIKGVAHQYYSPFYQRWITRTWPKGQGPDSEMRALGRATFSRVVQAIKRVSPEDRVAAAEMAANSPYLDRDLLYKAATGTLMQFTDDTGRFWMSTRIAIQAIQPMLDSISATPGAMLWRNANYWDALAAPSARSALLFDPAGGVPEWMEENALLQALLDNLSTAHGAILFRGATAWEVLAPGPASWLLKSNGAAADIDWTAPPPPAAPSGYPPGTPPGVVQVAYKTNSMHAVVFAAAPTAGNLLVAMTWNPVDNVAGTGWTKQFENATGTDWGTILTKVAGVGESATQAPMNNGTATAGAVIWELHGASTPTFVVGNSQAEVTALTTTPVLIPCAKDCIALAGVGIAGGVIQIGLNAGTQDVLDNTGNRQIYAGHGDLSSIPVAGVFAKLAASVGSKGLTCLVKS